jgi:uncharacterized protein DUF1206
VVTRIARNKAPNARRVARSAAMHSSPGQAKGIDATLRTLAATPVGPWLLAVVALGLVTFGVYSLADARWRRL